MKMRILKILMVIGLFGFGTICFAQKNRGPEFLVIEGVSACDTVWVILDKNPEYSGGMPELYHLINTRMKNPQDLNPLITTHRLMIRLLVDADGNVVEKKVLRPLDPERTADVMQSIEKLPKLIPGEKKGRKVCSYLMVSVNFSH